MTTPKNSTMVKSDAAKWLLCHLFSPCQHQFTKVTIEKGLHVRQVMTNVEASAMWTESNVSINQARIILPHIHHCFKLRVQILLAHMTQLSNITDEIEPVFDHFIYKKDGVDSTQIRENVRY